MGLDCVIFDLETTGLSPRADEIIQIAAVRMRDGWIDEADWFFSYVNPGRPVPYWITQYTGVTNQDVSDAPGIAEVLAEFSRYSGDLPLLAHNGRRFDMKFLAASCLKHQLPTRPVQGYDSMALSKLLWGPRGVGHGLDAVLCRLRISEQGVRRHDARGDVRLLSKAVQTMWNLARAQQGEVSLPTFTGVLPAAAVSMTMAPAQNDMSG